MVDTYICSEVFACILIAENYYLNEIWLIIVNFLETCKTFKFWFVFLNMSKAELSIHNYDVLGKYGFFI